MSSIPTGELKRIRPEYIEKYLSKFKKDQKKSPEAARA
jgi:ribosomal protein S17E